MVFEKETDISSQQTCWFHTECVHYILDYTAGFTVDCFLMMVIWSHLMWKKHLLRGSEKKKQYIL